MAIKSHWGPQDLTKKQLRKNEDTRFHRKLNE